MSASGITHNPSRIVIDARHTGPGATGIGRYTVHLIEELRKLDKQNRYYIFFQKKNYDLIDFSDTPNFRKVLVDAPIYSVKEQILLPLRLILIRPHLTHFPHFNIPVLYKGKFVVTIHDLTVSEFGGSRSTTLPKPLYLLKLLAYNFSLKTALKRSEKIIVPSKSTKKKVLAHSKVDPKKIAVTYEAGEIKAKLMRSDEERRVENVLGKFKIEKPFFLYVGNVYPFKNVGRLVDAIKILNEDLGQRATLVLVGSDDFFRQRLKRETREKGALKYVYFTGWVSDPDLIDLYSEAQAFVFPSLSEGFGIPALEAMLLGTPVICSNVSSLPEVCGDAALYFDPLDTADMAKKLEMILTDDDMRANLAEKGKKHAQGFSWRRMADQTLKVYNSVLMSTA